MIKGNKGFTLIELIIVIAIIAILAAAIIPNMIGFDREAKVATTKANLETIRARVALFRGKLSRYPNTLGELTTQTYNDAGATVPFLDKIPDDLVGTSSDLNGGTEMDANRDQVEDNVAPGAGSNDGGWTYGGATSPRVAVDNTQTLDDAWGEFSGEIPASW